MAQRLEVPEQLTLAYKGVDRRTAAAGIVYPKKFGLEGLIRDFLNWAATEPSANFRDFNAFLVNDIDLVGISLEEKQQKPEEVVLGDENFLFDLAGELLINIGSEIKTSKPAHYQATGDAVRITSQDLRRSLDLDDRKRVILYEGGTNSPIGAADLGIRFLEPGNLEIVSGYMHGVRIKKIEGEPGDTKYEIEAGHLKFRSRDGRWKVGQVSGELVAPDLLLEERYALAKGWAKNLVGRKGNRSKSTSQLLISNITDVVSSGTRMGGYARSNSHDSSDPPAFTEADDKPKAPPIPAPPKPIHNSQKQGRWKKYLVGGLAFLGAAYVAGLGIRSCVNLPSQTSGEKQAWSEARSALDEGEYTLAILKAQVAQEHMRWYERFFFSAPGLNSDYEKLADGVIFFKDRVKPGTDKRYAEIEKIVAKLQEDCGEQDNNTNEEIKDKLTKLEAEIARLSNRAVPCVQSAVLQPAAPTVIYVEKPTPKPKPKKKPIATGRLTIVGKLKPRQTSPAPKIEIPPNLPPVEIPEEPEPELEGQSAYMKSQPFRTRYKSQISDSWNGFTDENPGVYGRVKIRYTLESDGSASDCEVIKGTSDNRDYVSLMREFGERLCNIVLGKTTKIPAPQGEYFESFKLSDKR